jgi:hypothetical protein
MERRLRMAESRHRYWSRQIDGVAREVSKLSVACDIEILEPGIVDRILDNDDSVCGRKNPETFQDIRRLLMGLFVIEDRAVNRIGAEETKVILQQVQAAIVALRDGGKARAPD